MEEHRQTKQRQATWRWVIVVLCSAAVVAVGVAAYLQFFGQKNVDVNTFASCKEADGRIAESDPEQCTIDGKTFSNDSAVAPDDYVGMQEQAALDKAVADNKAARIVQRDGESLPVTMDFNEGRLNFSVNDGVVSKVDVERAEQ